MKQPLWEWFFRAELHYKDFIFTFFHFALIFSTSFFFFLKSFQSLLPSLCSLQILCFLFPFQYTSFSWSPSRVCRGPFPPSTMSYLGVISSNSNLIYQFFSTGKICNSLSMPPLFPPTQNKTSVSLLPPGYLFLNLSSKSFSIAFLYSILNSITLFSIKSCMNYRY